MLSENYLNDEIFISVFDKREIATTVKNAAESEVAVKNGELIDGNKFCGIKFVVLPWLEDDEWYLVKNIPNETTLRNQARRSFIDFNEVR